jgi:hypothetical protein
MVGSIHGAFQMASCLAAAHALATLRIVSRRSVTKGPFYLSFLLLLRYFCHFNALDHLLSTRNLKLDTVAACN